MTTITIAHSPDADDIFMFYGLACGAITVPGITFSFVQEDIEVLNHLALEGRYPITAISFAAYPYIQNQYLLMTAGASMGEAHYGPVVVAKTSFNPDDLANATIAIPGKYTSAALILKLAIPFAKTQIMPFRDILPAVANGQVDAGLLIHESQLQFSQEGCRIVLDLPTWWKAQFDLPIPLGTNAIRRDLDPKLRQTLTHALKQSIAYSLAHRQDALQYTQSQRDGHLPISLLDHYVGMYVNARTLNIGDEEYHAVQMLYDAAFGAGAIDQKITPEWI